MTVAAVVLAVPLFATLGLSLPLPVTVERLAANLVPFANAGAVEPNAAREFGRHGTIVRLPGERRRALGSRGSSVPAAPRRSPAKPTTSHRTVAPGVAAAPTPRHEPVAAGDQNSANPSNGQVTGQTTPSMQADTQPSTPQQPAAAPAAAAPPANAQPATTQPATTTTTSATTTSGNGNGNGNGGTNPNAGGANAGGSPHDSSPGNSGANNGNGGSGGNSDHGGHGAGHSP